MLSASCVMEQFWILDAVVSELIVGKGRLEESPLSKQVSEREEKR